MLNENLDPNTRLNMLNENLDPNIRLLKPNEITVIGTIPDTVSSQVLHIYNVSLEGKNAILKPAYITYNKGRIIATSGKEANTLNRLQGVTAVPELYGVVNGAIPQLNIPMQGSIVEEVAPGVDLSKELTHISPTLLRDYYKATGYNLREVIASQVAEHYRGCLERGLIVTDVKLLEFFLDLTTRRVTRVDYDSAYHAERGAYTRAIQFLAELIPESGAINFMNPSTEDIRSISDYFGVNGIPSLVNFMGLFSDKPSSGKSYVNFDQEDFLYFLEQWESGMTQSGKFLIEQPTRQRTGPANQDLEARIKELRTRRASGGLFNYIKERLGDAQSATGEEFEKGIDTLIAVLNEFKVPGSDSYRYVEPAERQTLKLVEQEIYINRLNENLDGARRLAGKYNIPGEIKPMPEEEIIIHGLLHSLSDTDPAEKEYKTLLNDALARHFLTLLGRLEGYRHVAKLLTKPEELEIPKEVLTLEEIAKFFCAPEEVFKQIIADGKLPYYVDKFKLVFGKSDVREFVRKEVRGYTGQLPEQLTPMSNTEVAEVLGMSKVDVYLKAKNDEIPHIPLKYTLDKIPYLQQAFFKELLPKKPTIPSLQLINDLKAYIADEFVRKGIRESLKEPGVVQSPEMRSRLEEQLRAIGPNLAKKIIERYGLENISINNRKVDGNESSLLPPNHFYIYSAFTSSPPPNLKKMDVFKDGELYVRAEVLEQIVSGFYGPKASKSLSAANLKNHPEQLVPYSDIPKLFPGLEGINTVVGMLGRSNFTSVPFESPYFIVMEMQDNPSGSRLFIANVLEATYSAHPEKVPQNIFGNRPLDILSPSEVKSVVAKLDEVKNALYELPVGIVQDVAAKLGIQNPQEYIKPYHSAWESVMNEFKLNRKQT